MTPSARSNRRRTEMDHVRRAAKAYAAAVVAFLAAIVTYNLDVPSVVLVAVVTVGAGLAAYIVPNTPRT